MLYIVDLDGTICDIQHRLHHIKKETPDWDAFNKECVNDTPIEGVCDIIRDLIYARNNILFLTGRSKVVLNETNAWIEKHITNKGHNLMMREVGDHRPDHIVKKELLYKWLDCMQGDKKDVAAIFEDRKTVVDMWREEGFVCLQVAPGDF